MFYTLTHSLPPVTHTIDNRLTSTCAPPPFILGAMKAGTEAMFEYINAHPAVKRALPQVKPGPIEREIHFFGSRQGYGAESMTVYEHVTRCHEHPQPVVIDCTPDYLVHSATPHNIKAAYAAYNPANV